MSGREDRTFPAYTILQQTPVNASSVNKTNRLLRPHHFGTESS